MENLIKIIQENSLTVRCLPHKVVSHWSYRDGDEERVQKPSYDSNGNIRNVKKSVVFSEDWGRKMVREESLQIVNRVSSGVVEIIKRMHIRPRFFIAKGGITSSDILTKALNVKKARVLGQIIPGVPVWQLDDCPAFPGLLFMPFPGNLGGNDAVYKAVMKFT